MTFSFNPIRSSCIIASTALTTLSLKSTLKVAAIDLCVSLAFLTLHHARMFSDSQNHNNILNVAHAFSMRTLFQQTPLQKKISSIASSILLVIGSQAVFLGSLYISYKMRVISTPLFCALSIFQFYYTLKTSSTLQVASLIDNNGIVKQIAPWLIALSDICETATMTYSYGSFTSIPMGKVIAIASLVHACTFIPSLLNKNPIWRTHILQTNFIATSIPRILSSYERTFSQDALKWTPLRNLFGDLKLDRGNTYGFSFTCPEPFRKLPDIIIQPSNQESVNTRSVSYSQVVSTLKNVFKQAYKDALNLITSTRTLVTPQQRTTLCIESGDQAALALRVNPNDIEFYADFKSSNFLNNTTRINFLHKERLSLNSLCQYSFTDRLNGLYSTQSQNFTLPIEFEIIKNKPLDFFISLRDLLLHNSSQIETSNGFFIFPRFKIDRDDCSDVGGVTRSVITTAFNAILKDQTQPILQTFRDNEKFGAFPRLTKNSTFYTELQLYHTIGMIFGYAYTNKFLRKENQHISFCFTIGKHFHPQFFKALHLLSLQDLEGLESCPFQLSEMPKNTVLKIFSCLTDENLGIAIQKCCNKKKLNEVEKEYIKTLLDELSYETIIFPEDPSQYDKISPFILEAVKNRVESNSSQKPYSEIILGTIAIALGMKRIVQTWDVMQTNCPQPLQLQQTIEGVITKEDVLQAIPQLPLHSPWVSYLTFPSTDQQFFHLKQWIQNAKNNDLSLFVEGVTGSSTLIPGTEIILELKERSTEITSSYPTASTCYNTLKLPNSTKNYDDFCQKMSIFIKATEAQVFGIN